MKSKKKSKKNSTREMRIGLLGLGTVGCGVLAVLARNAHEIERRAGCTLKICSATAYDLSKERPVDLSGIQLVEDPLEIVRDKNIDVIVELIGGYEPARSLIKEALISGKHVVTANKALIADYGNEIFQIAQAQGLVVSYEAAVAGGIPIVKAIREALAANRIQRMVGIINGTTNYILTEISERQRTFAEALSRAQLLGYSEADPTLDVSGIDTAHKLMIMASTAFGIPLQFLAIHIKGIIEIETQDVSYAKELGYEIKHLGIAKRVPGGIELRVHPTLVPSHSMLANVSGVMNAVMIDSDAAGSTLYYGAGAGADATASAVIADLIDLSRLLDSAPEHQVPHLAFQPGALSDIPILDIGDIETAWYLRMQVEDKPGVLAFITRILSELSISIEAVLQKDTATEANRIVPLIMLVYPVKGKDLGEAIARIEESDDILSRVVCYRLEQFDGC